MNRRELDKLTRDELIARAERLGVARPRVLTQPELIDEIVIRMSKSASERARSRGWLGRARDLLASVVERGLHMPEAARVVRGSAGALGPKAPPPLPTVTLAEIYAAQGHFDRAVGVLDEVLAREPEHAEALSLRERFAEQAGKAPLTAAAAAESDESEETELENADTQLAAPVAPVAAKEAASDTSLSARYDLDEVVAVAVDPRTIYLYWEVRPTTLARARAERPSGHLTIRVANVAASWDGPNVATRDIAVDALFGDHFVRDAEPGTHVRVSIGWLSDAHFDPFAVGMELSMPREDVTEAVAHEVMRWSPKAQTMPFGAMPGPGFSASLERAWGLPEGVLGGDSPRAPGVTASGSSEPSTDRFFENAARAAVEGLHFRSAPGLARRGGASELGRLGPGGASDLSRGGASELYARSRHAS